MTSRFLRLSLSIAGTRRADAPAVLVLYHHVPVETGMPFTFEHMGLEIMSLLESQIDRHLISLGRIGVEL